MKNQWKTQWKSSNLLWIFTRPSCLTKFSCFWRGRVFIRPSAGISAVGTQLILSHFSCTSCHSQCLWISTCRNLVISLSRSLVIRPIICWLSQSTAASWPGFSCIEAKNHFHQYNSLAACITARSSVSVLNVVTDHCLVECHSMVLPNSLNKYPSELCLVSLSSANAVSLEHAKILTSSVSAENSMTRPFVSYR